MIWYLALPPMWILALYDIYKSGFPGFHEGYSRNFLEWCFMLFVWVSISLILSLIMWGISSALGTIPEREGKADKKYPLIALREKDGMVGQFFLGSGYVGSTEYYFWYRKNEDGSVSGGRDQRCPGVRIYEDAAADGAYMQTFKTHYKNQFFDSLFWFFIAIDMRDSTGWSSDFHIPLGSIKSGYIL